MREVSLKSVKWLKNHGVSLVYGRRGRKVQTRYVAPNGRLTIGEATKLMGLTHTRLDRLRIRGKVRLVHHGPVRMVTLAECRRLMKTFR